MTHCADVRSLAVKNAVCEQRAWASNWTSLFDHALDILLWRMMIYSSCASTQHDFEYNDIMLFAQVSSLSAWYQSKISSTSSRSAQEQLRISRDHLKISSLTINSKSAQNQLKISSWLDHAQHQLIISFECSSPTRMHNSFHISVLWSVQRNSLVWSSFVGINLVVLFVLCTQLWAI